MRINVTSALQNENISGLPADIQALELMRRNLISGQAIKGVNFPSDLAFIAEYRSDSFNLKGVADGRYFVRHTSEKSNDSIVATIMGGILGTVVCHTPHKKYYQLGDDHSDIRAIMRDYELDKIVLSYGPLEGPTNFKTYRGEHEITISPRYNMNAWFVTQRSNSDQGLIVQIDRSRGTSKVVHGQLFLTSINGRVTHKSILTGPLDNFSFLSVLLASAVGNISELAFEGDRAPRVSPMTLDKIRELLEVHSKDKAQKRNEAISANKAINVSAMNSSLSDLRAAILGVGERIEGMAIPRIPEPHVDRPYNPDPDDFIGSDRGTRGVIFNSNLNLGPAQPRYVSAPIIHPADPPEINDTVVAAPPAQAGVDTRTYENFLRTIADYDERARLRRENAARNTNHE